MRKGIRERIERELRKGAEREMRKRQKGIEMTI